MKHTFEQVSVLESMPIHSHLYRPLQFKQDAGVVLLFLSSNTATIADGKCASKPPQFSGIVARAEKKLQSLKRLTQTKKVDMAGCGTLYLDRNRGGEICLSGSTCDGSPSQLFRSSLQSDFTKQLRRFFRLDFSRQSPEG